MEIENRCEFVDTHTIRFRRRFDVDVERVWRAVTTKSEMDQWFMVTELDLRVGGRFSFEGGWDGWVPEDAEEAADPNKPPRPIQAVNEETPRDVAVLNEADRVVPGAVGQEIVVHCRLNDRAWRLIVRFYRVGDFVHVVRGYGPASNVRAHEEELRQVLDSFRVVP